jgi:hypothetical protein
MVLFNREKREKSERGAANGRQCTRMHEDME